jgi:cobalt-zinc-cadmium efflux system membrane fusion protein
MNVAPRVPDTRSAEEAVSPRGRSRRWLLGIVALAVLALAWTLLHRPAPHPAATEASPDAADVVKLDAVGQKLAGITVEPAREVTRAASLEATAVVALDETRTARIGSQVEGLVVSTSRDVGDRVGRGALLASLQSHRVHDSWAAYRKAVAERRRAANELEFAKEAEARAQRLIADKAISTQELQRASSNRVAAEEQLDMAGTEVRRAEEDLEHLGVTNSEDPSGEVGEDITVRSPIAGVVLERLVTPGTAVTPGTQLFVVSDLSRVWVVAEVDESRLSQVATGKPVKVRVSAYPGEAFDGTVTLVGDVVNPKTRRVMVRCQVPNGAGRLKPEMFASVVLGTGESRPVVVVPAGAVHDVNGRVVVFVQEADGTFRARAVSNGPEADGLVEVRSGLKAGERIATTGSFLIKSQLLKASMQGDE